MTADEATPQDPLERLQRILEQTADRTPATAPASEKAPPRDPLAHLDELLRTAGGVKPELPSPEAPVPAKGVDPLERLAALLGPTASEPPRTEAQPDVMARRDPLAMLDSILEGKPAPAASLKPGRAPAPPPPQAIGKPAGADRKDRDRRREKDRSPPPSRRSAAPRVEPARAPRPRVEDSDPVDAAKQAFRESRRELGEQASLDEIIRHACKKLDADGQSILLQIQLKAMLGS